MGRMTGRKDSGMAGVSRYCCLCPWSDLAVYEGILVMVERAGFEPASANDKECKFAVLPCTTVPKICRTLA